MCIVHLQKCTCSCVFVNHRVVGRLRKEEEEEREKVLRRVAMTTSQLNAPLILVATTKTWLKRSKETLFKQTPTFTGKRECFLITSFQCLCAVVYITIYMYMYIYLHPPDSQTCIDIANLHVYVHVHVLATTYMYKLHVTLLFVVCYQGRHCWSEGGKAPAGRSCCVTIMDARLLQGNQKTLEGALSLSLYLLFITPTCTCTCTLICFFPSNLHVVI